MLPKRDGKPIAFKCTEEFRKLTEFYADKEGLSLSDYIRKAVEQRNGQHKQTSHKDKQEMEETKVMVQSFMKGGK